MSEALKRMDEFNKRTKHLGPLEYIEAYVEDSRKLLEEVRFRSAKGKMRLQEILDANLHLKNL